MAAASLIHKSLREAGIGLRPLGELLP